MPRPASLALLVVTTTLAAAVLPSTPLAATVGVQSAADAEAFESALSRYCIGCHNDRLRTAAFSLEGLDLSEIGAHANLWEGVVQRLRARTMPPAGRPRPEAETYDTLAAWLETELDRAAAASPEPGRTEAFHRLNRAEYRNAVRDLLHLDVDVSEFPEGDLVVGVHLLSGRVRGPLVVRFLQVADGLRCDAQQVGQRLAGLDGPEHRAGDHVGHAFGGQQGGGGGRLLAAQG